MDNRPYPELELRRAIQTSATVSTNWRDELPVLGGHQVTLRELRFTDAASLFALLTTDEVARFISPPPASLDAFERFIAWALRQRAAGSYVCYAVTLKGFDTAIGIFQVKETEHSFRTAEWGFALGSAFWGTGIFEESASLLLRFAFETLSVHRLEARAAIPNGRGNGALQKLGAVQEGILRKSFLRNGVYVDQFLYGITREDWQAGQEQPASVSVH